MKNFDKILIGCVVFLFTIFLTVSNSYSFGNCPNGAVSYWTFDDSNAPGKDGCGNNNGTLYGPTWVSGGKVGGALKFDGIDDYMRGSMSSNRPINTFSFEAWITTEVTHEVETENNYSTGGTVGQKYTFWPDWITAPEAGAGLSVGTNGITVYEHSANYMPPIAVYSGNIGTSWNHIVIVYNDKQPSIYLNGNLVRTGLKSTRSNIYIPLTIGGQNYGYHKGMIDEVALYNRALTQQEITDHYNAGLNGTGYCGGDIDQDKIGDLCDNCPNRANEDQSDLDLDGLGDACDCAPQDPNEPGQDGTCPKCGGISNITPGYLNMVKFFIIVMFIFLLYRIRYYRNV